MWTAMNRGRYDRSKLRYPSDLTDDEWAHVEPLIPPAKRGGNRRHVDVREVMNGIMYVLSTGCQWRAIPKDLPARSTLFDDPTYGVGTARWIASIMCSTCSAGNSRDGTQARPPDHRQSERQERGKRGVSDPPGYDAGKKIKGKKRHLLVDTQGLLLQAIVHSADIQDRDGGVVLLRPYLGCIPS